MLILVGPSASGKTEIAKTLVTHFNFKKIITTTTREKRPHEIDDIDYHFLSLESFSDLENQHAFVETSIYQNNKYGLQKKDVIPYGVVILDPKGANHLKHMMKEKCFVIYVQTSRNIREHRLLTKGESDSIRLLRLQTDDFIFDKSQLDCIDYVCFNDNLTIHEAALRCSEVYQKFIDTLAH
jgi:guanylate kinase